MKERVQKLLAQANFGSRRACEEIIRQGRVRVNGRVIQVGDQADPATDVIEVDGERLKLNTGQKVYYAVYKPLNVLSTNAANWQDERPIMRDMLPIEGHLFTIGRLDADSEGLMVMTNDGELTNKLAHPRYEHTKTYRVVVHGRPTSAALEEWQNGIFLEEGRTAPCYVRVVTNDHSTTTLQVVMVEGKKRQIRRVAGKLGYPVKKLMRTHIGQLGLGDLKRGEWAQLTPEQVEQMKTPAEELTTIRRRKKALRASGQYPGFQRGTRQEHASEPDESRSRTAGRGRPVRSREDDDERPRRPRANRLVDIRDSSPDRPRVRRRRRDDADTTERPSRFSRSEPAGESRERPTNSRERPTGGSRRPAARQERQDDEQQQDRPRRPTQRRPASGQSDSPERKRSPRPTSRGRKPNPHSRGGNGRSTRRDKPGSSRKRRPGQ